MTPDKTIIACTRPASRSNTLLERGPPGARRGVVGGSSQPTGDSRAGFFTPQGPQRWPLPLSCPWGPSLWLGSPASFGIPAVSGDLSTQPPTRPCSAWGPKGSFFTSAASSVGLRMWELREAPQTPSLAGDRETGMQATPSQQLGQERNWRFTDTNLLLHLNTPAFSTEQAGQPLGGGEGGSQENWLRDPNT